MQLVARNNTVRITINEIKTKRIINRIIKQIAVSLKKTYKGSKLSDKPKEQSKNLLFNKTRDDTEDAHSLQTYSSYCSGLARAIKKNVWKTKVGKEKVEPCLIVGNMILYFNDPETHQRMFKSHKHSQKGTGYKMSILNSRCLYVNHELADNKVTRCYSQQLWEHLGIELIRY